MQNISIEAAKAKGFISGYRVGRIILACSIQGDAHGITMTPSRCWKKSRDISSMVIGI